MKLTKVLYKNGKFSSTIQYDILEETVFDDSIIFKVAYKGGSWICFQLFHSELQKDKPNMWVQTKEVDINDDTELDPEFVTFKTRFILCK